MPRALKRDQLLEVVNLSTSNKNGFRNFAIIMTFLSSAIRLNELCQLQIGDVDTDQQTIKVVAKGKRGAKKIRTINLLGLAILKNYIKFTYQHKMTFMPEHLLNQLYIFSTDGGENAIQARTVQYFVKDLINSAKSIAEKEKKQFSVHTFRHCFAVYALESGVDIYTIAKLLGHESVETTAIYLKLFHDQLRKAVEKIPFANGFNKETKDEHSN